MILTTFEPKIYEMEYTDINKLVEIINANNTFVLTCHTNADGDALGSTLGLRQILINQGKEATVITPDLPPSFYSWMPGSKSVKVYERDKDNCDAIIDNADVIIMLDFNDIKRILSLGEKLNSLNKPCILIDHHTDPQTKADITFSFPEAPATCAIVFDIFRQTIFNQYIDINVATNLYTGIITDTGGLSYNSSDPEIYLLVAELLRKGIDKPYIHDKIFNSKNVRRLKLLGFTLSRRFHRIGNTPLSIMALSADDLGKFNYNTGDTEGFVNIALQAKDIIANVLILERPDAIKISIRSKGNFPVNTFASQCFNGGGHLNAAGGSYKGNFNDAIELYKTNIVKYYEEWQKQQSK